MRGRRYLSLFATWAVFVFAVFLVAPVWATSANISRSFQSDEDIQNGAIVSLDSETTDFVRLANTGNATRLLGVAVDSDDSLLAVDPETGKVQVATSGTASVLVSTLNGKINVGDQVSVSPFSGIGMKATPGAHVVGLAQVSFDSNSEGVTTQQIKDKDGKTSDVQVGYIPIGIAIGTSNIAGNAENINSLQKLARSLTGRTISTPRVIISMIVAFAALIGLVVLIYASIYGSIISVGRNPLAKYAIFRTLTSVFGMALLIAAVAGVTIVLLLR